ncbi:hypothetical protein UT300019_02030 [Clostridium sp. CTA-19]
MIKKTMIRKSVISIFLVFLIAVAFGNKITYAYTIFNEKINMKLRATTISTDKVITVSNSDENIERVSRGEEKNIPIESNEVVNISLSKLGRPYVEGAEGTESFDSAGFTKYIYGKYNVDLPHCVSKQIQFGKAVSKNELVNGDLVFLKTDNQNLSIAGVYVGNNNFVYADKTTGRVIKGSLINKYYSDAYVGARRIFD